MHILLTGASGFVGAHMISTLRARQHKIRAVCRTPNIGQSHNTSFEIVNLSPNTNCTTLLRDIDTVIHLGDGLRKFESLKVSPGRDSEQNAIETTLNLVRYAISAGVQNFVYLSSIKSVSGEYHHGILSETDTPSPTRPLYGKLKSQIETRLFEITKGSTMSAIALRSPIVYGPNSAGNFARLLKLADTIWPLPFGGLSNKRSIISVANLCDGLYQAAENRQNNSGAYFIHDGEAMTVPRLISEIRIRLDRPTRLFALPNWMLDAARVFPQTRPAYLRLTKPLELSDAKFRRDFAWNPPLSTPSALDEMVDAYKNNRSNGN